MDRFAELTGRSYHLFDYYGAPNAERIIVLMGSGAEAVHETVDYLNALGENVGVLKVRLYRPFDAKRFLEALPVTAKPVTAKSIGVLDRTKEPGSAGEPLYLDCITALHEGIQNGLGEWAMMPKVVGGRYGLSSNEFTPGMIKAVYDNLAQEHPKNHFTIGINDDLTHSSLFYDDTFSTEPESVIRAMFYGLGSDGTVGANKNSIKIIGENTDNFAQGYFVYDSKKSGAITVSHLRFGPQPIRSTYLITRANFIACHQPTFLERYDMLASLIDGGTFLLNTPYSKEEIWDKLPRTVQQQLIEKRARFFTINATKVSRESGMGNRINTVMQVCFFALSGVLPKDEAIAAIKYSIQKSYGNKGEEIVARNLKAVDDALAHLYEVHVPQEITSLIDMPPAVSPDAPTFVREVLGAMIGGCGDALPVSALPCDGTYPTATAKWEKRNLAFEIPVWETDVCIQCGKCAMVCPHSVIRIKAYDAKYLADAPATFKSCEAKDRDWQGLKYTIQVAPEDCTGCAICVDVCPAKNKSEAAVEAGQWLLYRFHPERTEAGENPLQLDSRAPKIPLEKYLYMENRFKMLTKSHPDDAKCLLHEAQQDVYTRWHYYEYLAARKIEPSGNGNGQPKLS
jgi:pyruvate-ferredoxin/flavodoxin oxidoreductase